MRVIPVPDSAFEYTGTGSVYASLGKRKCAGAGGYIEWGFAIPPEGWYE